MLTLVACASLLGASAHSSHQVRAAAHTAAATTLQVSSVTAWVNNGAVKPQCTPTVPFSFLGIVTFPSGNPGGTLYYFWSRSGRDPAGGGDQPTQTVTIQPGQTELSVTDAYTPSAALGNGDLLYDRLYTYTDPNTRTGGGSSLPVYISLVCSFYLITGSGSVSPTSWCNHLRINTWVVVTFSYTITVNPSPGGQVTFTLTRTVPGGSSSTFTPSTSPATVPGGAPSITVTDTWVIYSTMAAGPYSEQLNITSDPAPWSIGPVTFTKTC
jgi:hypothetical protein